jgi:hypothetical protein
MTIHTPTTHAPTPVLLDNAISPCYTRGHNAAAAAAPVSSCNGAAQVALQTADWHTTLDGDIPSYQKLNTCAPSTAYPLCTDSVKQPEYNSRVSCFPGLYKSVNTSPSINQLEPT